VTPPGPRRDDRRTILAWCLYDWANSGFTTLVVTFVYATYFTKAIAPNEVLGTAWWSRGVALTSVVVVILSPILGAMADRGGLRRTMLILTSGLTIAASAALTWVAPGTPHAALWALALFVAGNVGFELGIVFYNAYLPDIASPERIGRISGYGWAIGYVGGLGALLVALVGFVRPEVPWFGLTKAAGFNIRATNLLVAAWFLAFALPFFVLAPREVALGRARVDVRGAFRELSATFRQVRRFRDAARLLLARLFFNDGLNTVYSFGGIYAAGVFGLSFSEILVFGIVLNVMAGLGALAFGFVDDRIGGKRTIAISLVALVVATLLAVLAPSRTWLWVAGILIGIFGGPNQAASRSLMGRFTPRDRESEFFGFFAFTGKLASFFGPLLLGTATQAFGNQRYGLATVIGFFMVGGLILMGVDERRGMAAAREA
jgi:UMF1 family MFS transporter